MTTGAANDWIRRWQVNLKYRSIQPNEEGGVFPEPPGRLVVMGDLHGCWTSCINAFRAAQLIAKRGNVWHWSGGDAWVVQLGDQIDRLSRDDDDEEDEASEVRIMVFMDRMDREARKHGGRVISLAGNHELLNVEGDFRYVSPKGIRFFGNAEARRKAFQPGGPLALYMAQNRYAVVQIGDKLFVHGGISPVIARKYTVPELNKLLHIYLRGDPLKAELLADLLGDSGVFWSRIYSRDEYRSQRTQQHLEEMLQCYRAGYLFVGHTPQSHITDVFDGRVWRCDVGMSRAFGKEDHAARIQILEVSTKDIEDAPEEQEVVFKVYRVSPELYLDSARSMEGTRPRSQTRRSKAPVF